MTRHRDDLVPVGEILQGIIRRLMEAQDTDPPSPVQLELELVAAAQDGAS